MIFKKECSSTLLSPEGTESLIIVNISRAEGSHHGCARVSSCETESETMHKLNTESYFIVVETEVHYNVCIPKFSLSSQVRTESL